MMQLPPRSTILRRWRALLCAAAWLPAAAGAVELGDVVVHSHIGQQLSADIELVDLTADELNDLQARLARPDVFKGASISMHPALSGLNIAVVKRDKRRVLHLTTQRPIDGDLLHIFFEFSGGGRQTVRTASLWLTPDPAPVRSAAGPADGGGRPALTGNAVMAELGSRSSAPEAPAAKPPAAKLPAAAPQASAQQAVSVTPVSAAAKLSSTPPKSAASATDAGAGVTPSDAELSAALARATARRAAHAMPASASASAPAGGKGKEAVVAALALPASVAAIKRGKTGGGQSCSPAQLDQRFKQCVALDAQNSAIRSQLNDLEGKVKVLQTALAPAAAGAVAQGAVAAKAEHAAPAGQGASAAKAAHGASMAKAADGASTANAAHGAPASSGAVAGKVELSASAAASAASSAASVAKGAHAASVASVASAAAKAEHVPPAKSEPASSATQAAAKAEHGASVAPAATKAEHDAPAKGEHAASAEHAAAAKGENAASASASASAQAQAQASASASASASAPASAAAKASKPAAPPEKPKQMTRSRLMTMIAGGTIALLAVIATIVHFVRKRRAKMSSGPLKIWQSWRKKKPEEAAPPKPEPKAEDLPPEPVLTDIVEHGTA
ncbi:hypothetical protein [Massilia sp. YIM B04103]|uniref:FimV/HubP-related protein n=1 Tax=Massilia sp. YIM B04103 TaxID=2963106 RepID=UPI0021097BDA|nr:hypothetical protein [Massilia sp. YIM B04103]